MIYIKDKQNRTQVYVPRNGEVRADFVLETDFNELKELVNDYHNIAMREIYDLSDWIREVERKAVTKEYVDAIVGDINNVLENLLS